MDRFFGGNPALVLLRLAILSLIVGVVLAALGFSPFELIDSLRRLVERIYDMGFAAVEKAFRYFLLGAVIVFPVWLVTRLLKSLGRGRQRRPGRPKLAQPRSLEDLQHRLRRPADRRLAAGDHDRPLDQDRVRDHQRDQRIARPIRGPSGQARHKAARSCARYLRLEPELLENGFELGSRGRRLQIVDDLRLHPARFDAASASRAISSSADCGRW